MAWVRIQEATPNVGWICCRFSSLPQDVFLRLLWFSILLITNVSKFQKVCYFSIIRYLLFIHLGYVAVHFISDLILLLFFDMFEHFLFNLETYKQSSKNLSSEWVKIKIDLYWLDYIWLDTRISSTDFVQKHEHHHTYAYGEGNLAKLKFASTYGTVTGDTKKIGQ